jgi:base plate protein
MTSLKALPRIDHATFPIVLPISGKKLRFRPYLKKDDRILMQALEEGDPDQMYEATKQIIHNCITEGEVDVDKLPVLDVQYFFFNLRKRSVGPQIRLLFTCINEVEGTQCGHVTGVPIDIDEILKLKLPEKNFNIIKLTDTIGLKLRLPTYEISKNLSKLSTETSIGLEELKVKLLVSLIEQVFTEDEVFENTDEKELTDFLGNLSSDQFSRLEKFLDNIPTFRHVENFNCSKCGNHEDIVVEGFESFFV